MRERTDFPGDMTEVTLAQKVGHAVEAAYRRGQIVEKRRSMMLDWADSLGFYQSAMAIREHRFSKWLVGQISTSNETGWRLRTGGATAMIYNS
jgi:hypothetical protein